MFYSYSDIFHVFERGCNTTSGRAVAVPQPQGDLRCVPAAESIQPSLKFLQPPQELTSHRCEWTENAAAGKMAPEPPPLKGENLSRVPTPSCPSTFRRQSPVFAAGGFVVCRRSPFGPESLFFLLRTVGRMEPPLGHF